MKSMILNYGPYILICIPIFISVFIYTLGMKLTNNKWKSIHTTVQWSAIFYIIAVVLIVNMLFGIRLIGYIVIFLILIVATTLILQWKKGSDVELFTGMRIMWRVSFLLFFIVYSALIIYCFIYYIVL